MNIFELKNVESAWTEQGKVKCTLAVSVKKRENREGGGRGWGGVDNPFLKIYFTK